MNRAMGTIWWEVPVDEFSKRVAVVTGAARGLGAAYARALAEQGAAVSVLDVLADQAEGMAEDIVSRGGRALAMETDVADRNAFGAAVDATIREFGQVDILINNAGFGTTDQTHGLLWYEWPGEAWDKVVAVNMRGCFFGAQAVAPHMMERGWGRIINVSSATFWSPVAEAVHYVAAKGGVIGLIDIKPDKVADAADVLTKAGHKALGLTADVGNKKQLQEAVDKIIDGFGGIDILVNNAGYATTIDFVDIPEEEFDKVLDANLKGAFLLSQLAVPSMKQRGGGKIVNLTSTVSKSGPGDLVHYVATKSGIIGMTRALARALGPFNINVNALAPGMVATEPIIALYPREILDRSAAGRSIQRWEYAEDLVGTLTFLCSPASDFMTGQTIFVDGGHVFD